MSLLVVDSFSLNPDQTLSQISQQTNMVSSEVPHVISRTSFASIWRHRRPNELAGGGALGLRNPSQNCPSWGDFGNQI